jgi:hypothetical protein
VVIHLVQYLGNIRERKRIHHEIVVDIRPGEDMATGEILVLENTLHGVDQELVGGEGQEVVPHPLLKRPNHGGIVHKQKGEPEDQPGTEGNPFRGFSGRLAPMVDKGIHDHRSSHDQPKYHPHEEEPAPRDVPVHLGHELVPFPHIPTNGVVGVDGASSRGKYVDPPEENPRFTENGHYPVREELVVQVNQKPKHTQEHQGDDRDIEVPVLLANNLLVGLEIVLDGIDILFDGGYIRLELLELLLLLKKELVPIL